MNIAKASIAAMSMFLCGLSLAAEPGYEFDQNRDAKSFTFILENSSDKEIHCKSIVVEAEFGEPNCSKTSSYRFSDSDIRLKPGTKIVNPSFGIDYLYHVGRRLKSDTLVYCGVPTINLNCK